MNNQAKPTSDGKWTWTISGNSRRKNMTSLHGLCGTCSERFVLDLDYFKDGPELNLLAMEATLAQHPCTKDLTRQELIDIWALPEPDESRFDPASVYSNHDRSVVSAPDWDEETLRANFPPDTVEAVLRAREEGFAEDHGRGLYVAPARGQYPE